jgi:hypothetical protein
MVVDFFDGKATSPGCHEPEPKEKWLAGSAITDFAGAHKSTEAGLWKKASPFRAY